METTDTKAHANELYWGSDRSVNQIAEDLDLSKGALYEMIEPIRTGLACPECAGETVFSNRTAKDRGKVGCPSCEWSGKLEETTPIEQEPGTALAPIPGGVREDSNDLARTIAGGALLGAALGLALVLWARRG